MSFIMFLDLIFEEMKSMVALHFLRIFLLNFMLFLSDLEVKSETFSSYKVGSKISSRFLFSICLKRLFLRVLEDSRGLLVSWLLLISRFLSRFLIYFSSLFED